MTRKLSLIFLSCLLPNLSASESDVKSCQAIGKRSYMVTESLMTCVISRREMTSEEFTIADVNESVKALDFQRNRHIEALPIEVDKNFPNLVLYNAAGVSVKSVSKKNFVNLSKLEEINLKDCRIEKIYGNTFEDQTILKRLILSGNIIKHINLDFIAEMPQINHLSLKKNVCIDQNFLSHTSIANQLNAIKEKCGFDEEAVA